MKICLCRGRALPGVVVLIGSRREKWPSFHNHRTQYLPVRFTSNECLNLISSFPRNSVLQNQAGFSWLQCGTTGSWEGGASISCQADNMYMKRECLERWSLCVVWCGTQHIVTLAAVPLALCLKLTNPVFPCMSPFCSESPSLLVLRVSSCEWEFVCWLFKRAPAFLRGSGLTLGDGIPADFHSQMLSGLLLLALVVWAVGFEIPLSRGDLCN